MRNLEEVPANGGVDVDALYATESSPEAKALAREFGNFVNGRSGRDAAFDFARAMNLEHPTIQQMAMAQVLNWVLVKASLPNGQVDGRTEASVRLARIIATAIHADPLTFISREGALAFPLV